MLFPFCSLNRCKIRRQSLSINILSHIVVYTMSIEAGDRKRRLSRPICTNISRTVEENMEPNWYYGPFSSTNAEALLRSWGMRDGMFLVRRNREAQLILSMAFQVCTLGGHGVGKVEDQAVHKYITRKPVFFIFTLKWPGVHLSHDFYFFILSPRSLLE